ncbi:MAG TPA: tetratricopeptide repeat protein [Stellaceae bacterium]|nr:tetratricopeptide repeat protein [Stellaceae bacterium]
MVSLTELLARGQFLHDSGRLAEAEAAYKAVLQRQPRHVDTLTRLGMLYAQRGELENAARLLRRCVKEAPRQPPLLNNLAIVLAQLGRPEEAQRALDEAIRERPDFASALVNRANVRQQLGRLSDALADLDRVLALKPGDGEALINRGNVLQDLRRYEEAIAAYDDALRAGPQAAALNNRGNALNRLQRHDEALASYEAAIRSDPALADPHSGRGIALAALGRYEEAVASYAKALALAPENAQALANRAEALCELGRYEEAADDYGRALEKDPAPPYTRGLRQLVQLQIGRWDDLEPQQKLLLREIAAGRAVSTPAALLPAPAGAALMRRCAELYIADRAPPAAVPLWSGGPYAHERLRIGYFSYDFREHAIAYLAAELFERHDRNAFEIIAFSYGPNTGDAMRRRLERGFDRFLDVAGASDRAIAEAARRAEIDIAVDLTGLTQYHRMGVFAQRPAPIQVNWLGFPGTSGASYFDYIVADAVLIPPAHRAAYSEKVVYLPDTYQVNDSQRVIADRVPDRATLGLPESGFVFASFCNAYKCNPDVFAIWMRLLESAAGSVLWLLEDNALFARHLRLEASRRGVAPERLVFAPRAPLPEHLARHRHADLCLDTFPYNGHTTTSDALWSGTPVVTWSGDAFAGRVAASLLRAIGLPELVAFSPAEYEALAQALARDPHRLAALREKLARHRLTQPLFDCVRFTRHLEAAYRGMAERQRAGLPPEDIVIAPL